MSPSHKIKKILTSADLPKDLSEDLKKELESHFYEKERDLRLSGVSEKEVEQKVEEDFGDEEIVGSYFNFVHKKSFYSLIKALMQNKNKPSIFKTVLLFILLMLFYQNTVFDMATVLELTRGGDLEPFALLQNNFRMWVLGLIFVLSFILVIRLFRGKFLAQKLIAIVLFIVICIEVGITYSLIETNVILPEASRVILDQELIENPQAYYDRNKMEWANFYNEADGYQLNLPQSYLVYRKDGSSDLIRYFFPNSRTGFKPEAGEIVAFGPAYADDQEMIDVQVFDTDNTPDKKEDETWLNYYLSTQLDGKKYAIQGENENGTISLEDNVLHAIRVTEVTLEEPMKMKHNLVLWQFSNRLYAFLYDAKNSAHQEILRGQSVHVPEGKMDWVTFDQPSCPFTINLPSDWGVLKQNPLSPFIDSSKGQEVLDLENNFIPLNQGTDCHFSGFGRSDFDLALSVDLVEGSPVEDYFKSKNLGVQLEGNTTWQDLPAKKILLETIS